jgi:hypothetical protein
MQEDRNFLVEDGIRHGVARAARLGAAAALVTGLLTAAGAAAPQTPTGLATPIVLTQIPARAKIPSAQAGGLLRADWDEGGRIVVATPGGGVRVLTAGFASAADPEVSFDGKRILFAGRKTAADPWCIYEMQADGTGARQVTCGPGSAREPIYLTTMYTLNPTSTDAWTQIAFTGARPGEVNEAGIGEARSLYACLLDGTRLRRLTFNLSSDVDPALLPDGRLVYASWQRIGLDHGPDGRFVLLAVNTDGTDMVPYSTVEGPRVRQMPAATPGGLLLFVEADSLAGDGAGRLGSITLQRPMHSHQSITAVADGLFLAPSALAGGAVLVSMRPADGRGDHAVYRLDPATGRRAKVFDAAGWHDVQAKPLAPRVPGDGRSSPVRDDDAEGKMYALDLSIGDLPEGLPHPGAWTRLRVLEGLPRHAATAGDGPLAARRLLGEAPVAEDGSVQVLVPANTPLMLQVIDADGVAQRSGAWIWTRNHYEQGCLGCHEDPERTPPNRFVKAIQVPGVSVNLPPALRRTVDFRNDVVPILRTRCAACHAPGATPPALDPGRGDDDARAVYRALLGGYVVPGCARTSPLAWHLIGRNAAQPWDGPVAAQPARPIPGGAAGPDDAERKVLLEWIDFGAAWDARADARQANADAPAVTPPAHPGGE